MQKKMKRILLTGATGYIGRYVLKELLKKKFKVTCFLRKGTHISFEVPSSVKIIKGDLLDKKSLDSATKDSDAVIHLAAAVRITSKKINYDVNVTGTRNLIKECKKNKIKRIIYISSVSVIRKRKGIYGKTKYMAEQLIKKSGMTYTIFRPTMIYGPEGQGINNIINYIKLFPLFIPLVGLGKYTRQPVSVEDTAKVIVMALDKKSTYNKIYPLAGSDIITFRNLVKMIAKEMRIRKILIPIPRFFCFIMASIFEKVMKKPPFTREHIRSLSEDTRMDISELIKDTGFKPIKLERGIKSLISKIRWN